MLIGVNWNSPQTLPIIQKLLTEKIADFCEIAVDNFIHLPPERMRRVLPDVPISLHILRSRFLERSINELNKVAEWLRYWIALLQPLYISDHLAQFAQHDRYLATPAELNYEKLSSHICERIALWQNLLGQKVFLENFASILPLGTPQASFFRQMLNATGAGLLFDFSNAHIAELNGVCRFDAWHGLLQQCQHFHVAGFRFFSNTGVAIDSHDTAIADEVKTLIANSYHAAQKTLLIELDANISFDVWKEEILHIKNMLLSVDKKVVPRVESVSMKNNIEHMKEFDRQNLWHIIFSMAPDLIETHQEWFALFLDWLHHKNISIDWKLHIRLLDWLCERRIALSNNAKKQLLIAAVTRWISFGMDHINIKNIIVASPCLPEIAVRLQKNSDPEKPGEVAVLRIPEQQMPQCSSYTVFEAIPQSFAWLKV